MTRNYIARRCITTALLIAGLIATPFAYAEVTLNFVNAEIDQVAKAIGAATDKTIIVDPRVKGQLNLVSEKPVPETQALKILQSALRMQGFALVQDHGVLKVVPEADAKLQGVPTYVGNTPSARGDQVITQVFELHNESANNLLPVLRPLISPNNTVAAYPANNTLVVTDYADNVQRIAQIIAGIDAAAGQQVVVVPLKNANAIDLAQQLTKLLDPGAIGSTDATLKVSVTADARTNSVLIRASNKVRLSSAAGVARQLDTPTTEPGNMHVVKLRNADAKQLAKTLRGMLGKGDNNSSADSNNANSFNQGNASGSGSTGASGMPPLPSSSYGSSGGSGAMGSGGGLGAGSSDPLDKQNADNKDDNQPGGMIQADPATNSLIITAHDAIYRNLRTVIDQLDARRAQVYIEALIVELQASTAENLGIQWQGALLSQSGNNGVYAGSNFATASSQSIVNLTALGYQVGNPATRAAVLSSGAPLLNNGLNLGVLHNFGGYLGLGALLQALATSSDANVLSTPNVITLDNEEAKIIVGQNIPIPSGSYATPNTSSGSNLYAFNTYDREDVGTVLHVKPQITEGGLLKLQLYTEVSAVDPGSVSNSAANGGVTINKRSVESTVLVDNGAMIVLGGLMSDKYQGGVSKVPLLGDIPWIGQLFRTENKARAKDNLMIFLRPVIVRDEADSTAIAASRYEYMRAQQAGYQTDNRLIKDQNVPEIPPMPLSANQGAVPADNILDYNQLTRTVPTSGTKASSGGAPNGQPHAASGAVSTVTPSTSSIAPSAPPPAHEPIGAYP